MWNNPERELPEEGQTVIFKMKVLHNTKIKYAVFEGGLFVEKDATRAAHEPSQIWGWTPFKDSNERS